MSPSNLRHLTRGVDLRRPAVAALVAFALALPLLTLLKSHQHRNYSVSRDEAVRAVLDYRPVARQLRGLGPTKIRVSPLDRNLQRVALFDGERLVVNAAVDESGKVRSADGPPRSGSPIANDTRFLILLTLVFVLATATLPLASLRNLDVFAVAGFTAAIWLLDRALIFPSLYVAYPLLAYLAGRCMWMGLRGPDPAPESSLLWRLTRGWPSSQRTRVMCLALIAAAAVVIMVSYSSQGSSDVAFACLAGATDLLHGISPYGHIPVFIIHGDSYPLLSYVLYMPAALFLPVSDAFSDPTGALVLDIFVTLLGGAGLYWIGRHLAGRNGGDAAGSEPPGFAGARIALAWLVFPALILCDSSGSNDPLLAFFLIVAFACFARRGLSAFLLAIAIWVKVVPIFALPIWLARLSLRAALWVLAAITVLSGALIGWLLVLGGSGALTAMAKGMVFQLDRGALLSLYSVLRLRALQPIAGALLLAAIVAATLAVRRDPGLREDLPRMAALFGGVILLAQISGNFWTWAYLPWALVPLLLSLLGPAPRATTAPADKPGWARLLGPPQGLGTQQSPGLPLSGAETSADTSR